MAGVLDALASYIQNMLMEMARDEVHMLLGVSEEINIMGVKLRDLKTFLADADRRSITDQRVQAWVRELRDAMYDATNILDLCQLKAMEQRPSHDVGCLNPLLFCMRNPLHAHDIGNRIKNLNRKLDAIKALSMDFCFIRLGSYEQRNRRVLDTRPGIRETRGFLDESRLVGVKIEEDARNLAEILTKEEVATNEEDKIMIFAIVGVGGIGKTTLAQKIFNNVIIRQEFTMKIWLSVNKDFSETSLLRRVINMAGKDDEFLVKNTRGELELTLMDVLNGHKTLLVMDDVWDYHAWEDVLKTPLFNVLARGSRVLVTTRHLTVAQEMKAKHPYCHVDKLDLEDAWSLLKMQVVVNENDLTQIEKLKDIGMAIVAKCDGLPLAVKVMGGFLRQKMINRREWENVQNNSSWSEFGMPEELNYAIYLSYEDLHPCLKSCFLHYSLLPKSSLFILDDIVGMWISEGFVNGNSSDLEELGKGYYNELIFRNLIEPDIKYTDQQVCNMHDIVRSFGQYVARDEALVAHTSEIDIYGELNSQKFIRLSLEEQGTEPSDLDRVSLHALQSLRTLILVGNIMIKHGILLSYLSNLRTLHLQYADFDELAESLYHLKHLRYLSIEYTNTTRLPESIGKMKFLQHISLFGCQNLVKIPNSIGKLRHLRFLELSGTSINNIPKGLSCLTNLRQLYGFPVHMDGQWCSLEELGPLSNLIRLHISRLENVSSSSFAIKARLDEKVRLKYLFLSCTSRLESDGGLLIKDEDGIFEKEKLRIKEVFDELCPPPCLENLAIKGYFGLQFPRWMISTPVAPLASLRIVTMEDLPYCTEIPAGLSQLPSLELLQINHAPAIKRFGPDFLHPYRNRHSQSQVAVEFPRLRELNLADMMGWEVWEWEENVQAMHALEELLLERCKLRHFPPALGFQARALKKLYIYNVENLTSLEKFSSVIHLQVFESPDLESISNLPKLQKLDIIMCQKMNVLLGLPALRRLRLEDYNMKTLPRYLQHVNPRYLQMSCSLSLLTSMVTEESSREWDKCNHIQQVKVYANDGDIPCKWYVLYTRDPFSFDTNVSHSVIAREMGDRTSKVEFLERSYMEPDVLQHILDGREEPRNLKFPLLDHITNNFSIMRRIGCGGCGEVYKGILKNGSVAVKRLFNSHTVEEKMFEQETKSMMMVRHKNIVRFLGYCSDTQGRAMQMGGKIVMAEERERLLCFEYLSNGSLDNHITDELRGLEWHTRYQIIMGICEGLNYLHNEKHILHMDLKPANILIDDHMVPKITDFGLSRLDGKSHTMSTKRLVSHGYCAPEYVWKGKMSTKSDIYSLGIIIIEMVTGSREKPDVTKVLGRWKHRWNTSSEQTPYLWYQQVTKCLNLALRCIRKGPIGRPCIWDIICELNGTDITDGSTVRDGTDFFEQPSSCLTDMLGIKPLEIHFPFAPDNKEKSCSIELSNDTDDCIAFRISQTSSLLPFSTQPERGVVQPQSKCRVKITLQPQEKAPVHNNHFIREEFCVQSTRVHESLTATDITEDIFNEELDKVVDEVNLPVVFDAQ